MLINKFDEPEKALLQQSTPKNLEDKFLYIVSSESFVSRLEKSKDSIEEALFELFNKKYQVKIISKQKYDTEYKRVVNSQPKTIDNNSNIEDITKLFPEGVVNIE